MTIHWCCILLLQLILVAFVREETTSMIMAFVELIFKRFSEQKNGFIM